MLSYPVMTGNKRVDERIYAHLNAVAVSHDLSETETQRCIITFARRMLHSLSERKSAGETMDGSDFVEWLERSAQQHPVHFRDNYYAVPAATHEGSGFDATGISRGLSSNQSKVDVADRDAVMLSDFDGVLASAACQLTPSSRLMIMWHYFGGLSVRDLARHFGLRQSDIRQRIVLAAAEMQAVLSRDCYARLNPDGYNLANERTSLRSRRVTAH